MTRDEIIKLVERYPYLLPRNVFTDKLPDDYAYDRILHMEIPKGWNRLFLQMCEDIRQPLINAKCIDSFRFTQIKEKYNRMECYHLGAPREVFDILEMYSAMAKYVCTRCGQPATCITQGYLASYCKDCRRVYAKYENINRIKVEPYFKITCISNGKRYEKIYSYQDEWIRYLESIKPPHDTIIEL